MSVGATGSKAARWMPARRRGAVRASGELARRAASRGRWLAAAVALCGACERPATPSEAPSAPADPAAERGGGLRAVSEFDGYASPAERSRALFAEAARVLLHPRCVNCHPNGDEPLQRDLALHDPPVVRGPEGRGVVGVECTSCHQTENLELSRVPGAPNWHLAPRSMAWVGKSAGEVCEQLKDPARNGAKTLDQIVEHSGHDPLVAWGFSPGHDREKAPGTQAEFGALVAAWAATGAECPPAGDPPTSPTAQKEMP